MGGDARGLLTPFLPGKPRMGPETTATGGEILGSQEAAPEGNEPLQREHKTVVGSEV